MNHGPVDTFSGQSEGPGRVGAAADRVIAAIAARQHGVVCRRQLLEAGVSPHLLAHRLATGRILPLHRGVYRIGPIAAPHAREMAAILACGAGAVLSHRTAAGLWGLRPKPDSRTEPDVALPTGRRRRAGIRLHRLTTLRTDEVSRLEGIPVTSPARTLLDLAAASETREIERALAEGAARRLVRPEQLQRILDRHPGAPGAARLRSLLETRAPGLTRSEAEERFLELVRAAQLEDPESNVMVGGFEVDFFWRQRALVVEVDGFAHHSGTRAFEGDRRRDARLAAAGLIVIRVTWRQLEREPLAVVARLAQALVRAGKRPR